MLLSIAMTSLSLLATGGGETYSSFYAQPDYDRWNYSFNGTAGSRIVGPTFSAYGSGLNFDDRDGQVLLGWVTIDIPSDLPASAYRLKSLSVEITTNHPIPVRCFVSVFLLEPSRPTESATRSEDGSPFGL